MRTKQQLGGWGADTRKVHILVLLLEVQLASALTEENYLIQT